MRRGSLMKMRRILYRLVGAVVAILGFGLILKFYYSTVMISAGTVILKMMKPKVRTVGNLIEEHHFEVLKVKYPNGSIKQVYLPCDDDNQANFIYM